MNSKLNFSKLQGLLSNEIIKKKTRESLESSETPFNNSRDHERTTLNLINCSDSFSDKSQSENEQKDNASGKKAKCLLFPILFQNHGTSPNYSKNNYLQNKMKKLKNSEESLNQIKGSIDELLKKISCFKRMYIKSEETLDSYLKKSTEEMEKSNLIKEKLERLDLKLYILKLEKENEIFKQIMTEKDKEITKLAFATSQIKEKIVEIPKEIIKYIEKPIFIEKIVEVPVESIQIRIIEKIVEVPIEKEIIKFIERPRDEVIDPEKLLNLQAQINSLKANEDHYKSEIQVLERELENFRSDFLNKSIDRSMTRMSSFLKISNTLEHQSSIFSESPNKDFLEELCEEKRITVLSLIFRASEHSFDATLFHENCDQIGKTLILVKSESGSIFGGVCSISWSSPKEDRAFMANGSFLFSMDHKSVHPLTEENDKRAIYCHESYGPAFNGGFVLNNFCDRNENEMELKREMYPKYAAFSTLGRHYKFDNHEKKLDPKAYLAGASPFVVKEYEVFEIKMGYRKKSEFSIDFSPKINQE